MSFVLRAAVGPDDPDFEPAYEALAEEFAARGELERREVIAGWLAEPADGVAAGDGLVRAYRLLVARNEEGALAGVRDFHVVTDRAAAVAVVYLAHVLVLPRFRRSGLAARFRAEPLAAVPTGLAGLEVLVAAEMEPPTRDSEASLVRLVAYGREGFSVIAPASLPYYQPDFRVLPAGATPRPIPLLAVVRVVGRERERVISAKLARAFVRHLYAVFGSHVSRDHLAELEASALGALAGAMEVPLVPLPRSIDDAAGFAPLMPSVPSLPALTEEEEAVR